ncbi:hypothetical protein ZHAS_00006308 [Anopheles sinensis]|uniref:Uncharacterized protein n=1 Tax=Anopheles sinensis TaxID=74873 RepID=A0A084VLH9_ANOSI|nr:hypothetical protein ZHAS_00006308 [Anopheles sinensis]
MEGQPRKLRYTIDELKAYNMQMLLHSLRVPPGRFVSPERPNQERPAGEDGQSNQEKPKEVAQAKEVAQVKEVAQATPPPILKATPTPATPSKCANAPGEPCSPPWTMVEKKKKKKKAAKKKSKK